MITVAASGKIRTDIGSPYKKERYQVPKSINGIGMSSSYVANRDHNGHKTDRTETAKTRDKLYMGNLENNYEKTKSPKRSQLHSPEKPNFKKTNSWMNRQSGDNNSMINQSMISQKTVNDTISNNLGSQLMSQFKTNLYPCPHCSRSFHLSNFFFYKKQRNGKKTPGNLCENFLQASIHQTKTITSLDETKYFTKINFFLFL